MASVASTAAAPARAEIHTQATTDPATLAAALLPSGLTITSVQVRSGVPGQIGTYTGFLLAPVTIRNGVVLSSGNIAEMGPIPGATDPGYDPSDPPPQINSQMTPDPDTGGTTEFDTYGAKLGHIENFNGSFDVAAIEVTFELAAPSQVQFDFIFGSVEYPYWVSQYTDAFLVFLDGLDPQNQITFDANGNAVQVGSSFAGLETTADVNTAFSNPHGLIHHLTTTTTMLEEGEHTLVFEVGDVNDHILDSAAFITGLRTGAGNPGTDPTDDNCEADLNGDDVVNAADLAIMLGSWGPNSRGSADLNEDDAVNAADLALLLGSWGHCS